MSWLLKLLAKIVPALAIDATTRLVQAARKSLRPAPTVPEPIGDSGVADFMRGAGASDARHELDERNAQAGANLAKTLDDNEARAEGIEQALGEGEGKP